MRAPYPRTRLAPEAATVALDEAARAGQIRAGSNLVLSGFGAGLAWGTAVFRW